MWFNIFLGNHGHSTENIGSLRPVVKYLRWALHHCGHETTVSQFDLVKDAINLIFEFAPSLEWSQEFIRIKKANGLRVGLVATELIVDGAFPYGNHMANTDLNTRITRSFPT